MLWVNAMIIWIKINHFNMHIMYKKDKHLLTLQCLPFLATSFVTLCKRVIILLSSLYVDEIGYYYIYKCTREVSTIFTILRVS